MSRIGKLPVKIPSGVDVKVEGSKVSVKGPKGQLSRVMHDSVNIAMANGELTVSPKSEELQFRRFHGLSRTLIDNMVIGVTKGFTKNLTMIGVGYRAQSSGKGLTISLGYSHPIEFPAPAGIELKVDKNTTIIVSGADKEMVGLTAARIRALRAPEPYHGKGVRYENEVIQTKVGKAAGKK